MYGIIDEKLLDYEDICNTYSELLEHEINKEQLNIQNIEEIAFSFAYIFKIIYPEYENIEIDIMEVYREKKDEEKISIKQKIVSIENNIIELCKDRLFNYLIYLGYHRDVINYVFDKIQKYH